MRRTHAWLAAAVVLGVAAEPAIGFVRFADGLPRTAAGDVSDIDAVAVLTGGSGRLEAGLDILAAVPHAKFFVSGVHRDADIGTLIAGLRPDLDPERIDMSLGRTAPDTRGNAAETAQWAAREGVTRLALVTAAYHMPRAEIEFRRAMPGVALVLRPVFPANVRLDAWWRNRGTARLLLVEYAKLRLAGLGL